jgi:hypothetical protein
MTTVLPQLRQWKDYFWRFVSSPGTLRAMTDKPLKIGGLAEAVAFRGQKIIRRVVEISNETVYLCLESEWKSANKEGREPQCVGFPRKDVSAA